MRTFFEIMTAALMGVVLLFAAMPSQAAEKTPAQVAASINPAVFEMEMGCTATKIGPLHYLTALHCAARLDVNMKLISMEGEYVFIRSILASTGEKSRVEGRRRREDWAILVAATTSKAPWLPLGCGEKPYLGQQVAYIGFPQDIERQFGMGYVAATGPARSNGSDFFIDVPGAPGSSGSAIVSLDSGNIIGVLTEGVMNTRTTEFFLVGVETIESLDVCEDWDRELRFYSDETHEWVIEDGSQKDINGDIDGDGHT